VSRGESEGTPRRVRFVDRITGIGDLQGGTPRGGGAEEAGEPGAVRTVVGQRLAGFIYGTIVALSVIVAGARAYPDSAGRVAALVAVTCVVFWLAHVYAHGLAHSVSHREHLSFGELRHIARREGSIVEAALPPVAALLLGTMGVLSAHAALWLAFALGLAVLAVQGVVFARVERLGRVGTLVVVTVNVGLGLVIVALKLFLTH
jgi:hypothetical protein